MIKFNHYLSGLYWGFGTIRKSTGEMTAAGDFCYLVFTEEGLIQRWEARIRYVEGAYPFDERYIAEQLT